ncbi:DUF4244 domain-containing protein [Granulicoccus sp. GXG6511]|uniref:DUF4244 domain-containing protein n=1 Tax=Granulicoccus sp. GXG6511 TaxID=3381351 RepID=UPI003D7CEF10
MSAVHTSLEPVVIDPVVANQLSGRRRTERGMTTAEYAVGTVAAASFAGVLIKILTDPALQALLLSLIQAVLELFMRVTPL